MTRREIAELVRAEVARALADAARSLAPQPVTHSKAATTCPAKVTSAPTVPTNTATAGELSSSEPTEPGVSQQAQKALARLRAMPKPRRSSKRSGRPPTAA